MYRRGGGGVGGGGDPCGRPSWPQSGMVPKKTSPCKTLVVARRTPCFSIRSPSLNSIDPCGRPPSLKREILRPDLVYLMRTTMLSAEEKQAVIDQLYTYNSLYDIA